MNQPLWGLIWVSHFSLAISYCLFCLPGCHHTPQHMHAHTDAHVHTHILSLTRVPSHGCTCSHSHPVSHLGPLPWMHVFTLTSHLSPGSPPTDAPVHTHIPSLTWVPLQTVFLWANLPAKCSQEAIQSKLCFLLPFSPKMPSTHLQMKSPGALSIANIIHLLDPHNLVLHMLLELVHMK